LRNNPGRGEGTSVYRGLLDEEGKGKKGQHSKRKEERQCTKRARPVKALKPKKGKNLGRKRRGSSLSGRGLAQEKRENSSSGRGRTNGTMRKKGYRGDFLREREVYPYRKRLLEKREEQKKHLTSEENKERRLTLRGNREELNKKKR